MQVISRSEAKSACKTRYFTGKPCKQGHVAERDTASGSCVECSRQKRKQSYWDNREQHIERQKRKREAEPEKWRAYKRKWREERDPELAARKALRAQDAEFREAARVTGHRTYQSVIPCGNGHPSERYTNDGKCCVCVSEANKRKRRKKIAESEGLEAYELRVAWERFTAGINRCAKRTRSAFYVQSYTARKNAIERGDRFYFSLRSCPKGHMGWRRAPMGCCESCRVQRASSDERKQYEKTYYQNNKQALRDRARRYRDQHREHYRRKQREYQKAHKETASKNKKAYKHRLRSAQADGLSGPEQREWEERVKKVCYWCGNRCAKKYHVDHYWPLSLGGAHTLDNLVISCPTCNQEKSCKIPYEFAQIERGRLF